MDREDCWVRMEWAPRYTSYLYTPLCLTIYRYIQDPKTTSCVFSIPRGIHFACIRFACIVNMLLVPSLLQLPQKPQMPTRVGLQPPA